MSTIWNVQDSRLFFGDGSLAGAGSTQAFRTGTNTKETNIEIETSCIYFLIAIF